MSRFQIADSIEVNLPNRNNPPEPAQFPIIHTKAFYVYFWNLSVRHQSQAFEIGLSPQLWPRWLLYCWFVLHLARADQQDLPRKLSPNIRWHQSIARIFMVHWKNLSARNIVWYCFFFLENSSVVVISIKPKCAFVAERTRYRLLWTKRTYFFFLFPSFFVFVLFCFENPFHCLSRSSAKYHFIVDSSVFSHACTFACVYYNGGWIGKCGQSSKRGICRYFEITNEWW